MSGADSIPWQGLAPPLSPSSLLSRPTQSFRHYKKPLTDEEKGAALFHRSLARIWG